MWNSSLQLYFDQNQYKKYRQLTKNKIPLSQKVQIIQNLQNTIQQDSIPDLIVKWCLNSYPKQFLYDYVPYIYNQTFKCNLCQEIFTKHLRMRSCNHIVCESCCQKQDWAKLQCAICNQDLFDIDFDPKILQQMLNSDVRCINYNRVIDVPISVNVPVKNNIDDKQFVPDLKKIINKFNNNQIPICYLNQIRQNQLETVNEEILEQIDGRNHLISFYEFEPKHVQVQINKCYHSCKYKDLQQHLIKCEHTYKQCTFCDFLHYSQVVQMHQISCPQRIVACPICYQPGIEFCHYEQHVLTCANQLNQLVKNPTLSQHLYSDVDLQLKITQLENSVDKLSKNLIQWDALLQKEVLEYAIISEQNKLKPPTKLQQFLSKFYFSHLPLFVVTSTLLTVLLLDVIIQICSYKTVRIISLILLIVQLFNISYFMLYSVQYFTSKQFQQSSIQFMFQSYFAHILWFAGIYSNLLIFDTEQFSGLVGESSQAIFVDLVYFSSCVSSKIGLGDVAGAKKTFSQIIITIHIFYSSFIVFVLFRGISFFVKTKNFEIAEIKKKKVALVLALE
ncbi:Transmembrane_domain-containing protein [Hexamita inflata]|uniref:Transmembrane domain-containing protein n=2 Tax=Hexamita inflata TaxID=28002 RepID=A0AA86UAT6_9EUKA|nr:Transmembrane domain-containing protein [Hexamita inflata]